jgi:hypothetical protein
MNSLLTFDNEAKLSNIQFFSHMSNNEEKITKKGCSKSIKMIKREFIIKKILPLISPI